MRKTVHLLPSLAAALLLASLLAFLAPMDRAEAAFPGANGRIAFFQASSAAFGTYTVDPAGGEAVRIGDAASDLAYSPDGTQIAFASSSEVWIMDADGSNRAQLTNTAGFNSDPSWYPGGDKIAVESSRAGKGTDVYALSLNAARDRVVGTKRLTNRNGFDGEPAVSLGGKKLAFASSRDGRGSIFVMRANAPEGPRNAPVKVASGGKKGWFGSPDWSPTGGRIVYDGYAGYYRDTFYGVGVYSVTSDGRRKRFLVDFGDGSPLDEADPVYSPDGTQIAYSLDGVWRMNPDGTSQTKVTSPGVSAQYPSWQALP